MRAIYYLSHVLSTLFLLLGYQTAAAFTGFQTIIPDTVTADRYYAIADSLYEKESMDAAYCYYQSAAAYYHQENNCLGIVKSRAGEALTLSHATEYDYAIKMLRSLLLQAQFCLKEKGVAESLIYQNLAEVYQNQRLFDSAFYYQEIAMEGFTRHFGPKHPVMANAYNRLGSMYHEDEQYEQAYEAYHKTLMIRTQLLGKDHLKVGYIYKNIATNYLDWGKYHQALRYYHQSLDIKSKWLSNDHPFVADAYNDLGAIYTILSDYNRSLEYYQLALEIRISQFGEQSVPVANTYVNMALIDYYLSDYGNALNKLLRSIAIHENQFVKNEVLLTRLLDYTGVIYSEAGNLDCALDYQNNALRILSEMKNVPVSRVASALTNIGSTYRDLGQYDRAMEYYEKAKQAYLKKYESDYIDLADLYFNMGDIQVLTESHDLARTYFRQALNLRLSEQGHLHTKVANCYNALGNVYHALEKYDTASSYYQKALASYSEQFGIQHPKVASIYNNMGKVHQANEQFSQAGLYFERALAIQQQVLGTDHPKLSLSYTNLGINHELSGSYEEAISYFQQAIAVKERSVGKKHANLADDYNNQARVFFKQKQYAKAVRMYQQAITRNVVGFDDVNPESTPTMKGYLHGQTLLHSLLGKVNALSSQGQAFPELKKPKLMDETYRACDRLIDQVRSATYLESDKVRLGIIAKEVYTHAIGFYLNEHTDFEYAHYLSEKSRAMVLLEAISDRSAQHYAGIPDDLLKNERRLRTQQAFLRQKLTGTLSEKDAKNYRQQLTTAYEDHQNLIHYLEEKYPAYYTLKHGNHTASARQIRQHLDQNTAMITYFRSDSMLVSFVLTQQNMIVHKIALPKTFQKTLQQMLTVIHTPPGLEVPPPVRLFDSLAYRLHDRLLKNPLAGLPAAIEKLILIPDGELNLLNFGTLVTDTSAHTGADLDFSQLSYVLKEYDISYAASANLWLDARQDAQKITHDRGESVAMDFGGFAPAYDTRKLITKSTPKMVASLVRSEEMPLPGAKEEVLQIAELVDGHAWTGHEVTVQTFRDKVADYNILHLAMHALLDDEDPMRSNFVFANPDSSTADYYLYASEIYTMNLNARLAVLSACNSGAGTVKQGEGIMSLSRAFVYAGCPSLVTSLWKTSDLASSAIMVDFYKNLKDGSDIDGGLRLAQLNYLKSVGHPHYSHPFYWAPFIAIGNTKGVRFDTSRSSVMMIMLSLSVAGVLSLALAYYSFRGRKNQGRISTDRTINF
ncbi:MAG: CHAT domain-containing tetratricopeptide repeat protein [Bacteroidota bacterium]